MSSDAHLRREHGTPKETSPYIDWGPDLPTRYEGGRARLLVANPTTLYLSWESDLENPQRWRVDTRTEGHEPKTADLPGGASDVWVKVSSNAKGEVHLLRDETTVAILPFRTPPDRPSSDANELWGRLDDAGRVQVDVLPVIGRPLSSMEEADAAIAAAKAAASPSSSEFSSRLHAAR